jgi:cellulose synthase/poly-beta-1,6-N-acetylglucosamine synthase-like glycosyltransferase
MERWHDLVCAVESARAQPQAFQVIVVIDHNQELLTRAQQRWPEVTVIPNLSKQGLSGARNTGLDVAEGTVVAFLDDDATADASWLARLLAPFSTPDVVAVGGAAHPVWPTGKPARMLPPELLWIVGCTHRGQPTELADVRNVIGCSMAFRTAPLRSVGGFNVDTGRVGKLPLGAEETEVCIRLTQHNRAYRIRFEPASVVFHRVTAERTTWRYVARRSFYEGVSKAALTRTLGSADSLSSERAYTARVLPRAVFRELTSARVPEAAAIVLCLVSAAAGYAYAMTRGHTPHSPISTLDASERTLATRGTV